MLNCIAHHAIMISDFQFSCNNSVILRTINRLLIIFSLIDIDKRTITGNEPLKRKNKGNSEEERPFKSMFHNLLTDFTSAHGMHASIKS